MNCKPGDLAWVRSTHPTRSLHGVTVQVDLFAGAFEGEVDVWHFLFAAGQTFLDDYGRPCTGGFIPDRHLTPISGVPVDDEVHDEVTA